MILVYFIHWLIEVARADRVVKDRLLLVPEDLDEFHLLRVPYAHLAGYGDSNYLQLLVVEADIDYLVVVGRSEAYLLLACSVEDGQLALTA